MQGPQHRHQHYYHPSDTLPIAPNITQRAFHVNPSAHEIAIGSVEQLRRSKLNKAWKNVFLSLVKSPSMSLCVWREVVAVDSNDLELIQQIPLAEIEYINLRERDNFVLNLSRDLEQLTFRCIDEPDAAQRWVTTLKTVCHHLKGQQQGGAAATGYTNQKPQPEVDLLSFDSPTQPNSSSAGPQSNWEQQLLGQPIPTPPRPQQQQQQQQRPYRHQTYPQNGQTLPPQHQQHSQYRSQGTPAYREPSPLGAFGQGTYTSTSTTSTGQTKNGAFQPSSGYTANTNNTYSSSNQSKSDWTKAFVQAPPPPKSAPVHLPQHQQAYASGTTRPSHPQQAQPPRMNGTNPRHSPLRRSLSAPSEAPTAAQLQEQIKKQVLLEWALQPPALQQLRPLSHLLRSITSVVPPRFQMVRHHSYFTKWSDLTTNSRTSYSTTSQQHQQQEDAKLLRKIKFLLHPDKLPRDFSGDQAYLCKMLWDIINDAQQQQEAIGK